MKIVTTAILQTFDESPPKSNFYMLLENRTLLFCENFVFSQ